MIPLHFLQILPSLFEASATSGKYAIAAEALLLSKNMSTLRIIYSTIIACVRNSVSAATESSTFGLKEKIEKLHHKRLLVSCIHIYALPVYCHGTKKQFFTSFVQLKGCETILNSNQLQVIIQLVIIILVIIPRNR